MNLILHIHERMKKKKVLNKKNIVEMANMRTFHHSFVLREICQNISLCDQTKSSNSY